MVVPFTSIGLWDVVRGCAVLLSERCEAWDLLPYRGALWGPRACTHPETEGQRQGGPSADGEPFFARGFLPKSVPQGSV